jgi:hypothetical protein
MRCTGASREAPWTEGERAVGPRKSRLSDSCMLELRRNPKELLARTQAACPINRELKQSGYCSK